MTMYPKFHVLQPLCQAYHDLANAYATNNPAEVRAAVTKHSETFTRVSRFYIYLITLWTTLVDV